MIVPLLAKEVKDLLRDPRILVPFILSALILPVVALVISVPMKSAVEQAVRGAQNIGVVDLDTGAYSKALIQWLARAGFNVTEIPPGSIESIAAAASRRGLRVVVILPEGFSTSIAQGRPANITVLSVVDEISMFSGVEVQPIVEQVKNFYITLIANKSGINPQVLLNPVVYKPQTYIASKKTFLPAGPTSLAGLLMAAILVPMVVMSISLVVMQMSATSMAVENEERTLETLLTMPVPPRDILTAKLLGMFIVSLVGSALELVGMLLYFLVYFATFLGSAPAITAPGQPMPVSFPGLADLFPPQSMLLLAPSLLISLFFAAALGVIVGALSRDVRIANTVMSPLGMLVVLPSYFVVFAPSNMIGPVLKAVLYTFPLTQPTILAKDIISSSPPPEALIYVVLSIALTLGLVYLTSSIISLETLSKVQYSLEKAIAKIRRTK
ncbi:ABC transporter permease [Infirmifilum lucidum]|uniref:ABC transporter permease n=1 Tax=Infirmifilum lucidum TaxID=2776706 RepID=A0A7L9FIG4_9CREN|nr:ABC transporter permease [Infirmifilum lucidum]QOJ79152.1 ABC transporter permease [Infirmifilum lucidum]